MAHASRMKNEPRPTYRVYTDDLEAFLGFVYRDEQLHWRMSLDESVPFPSKAKAIKVLESLKATAGDAK